MEISPMLFWYLSFFGSLSAFIFILYREKSARFISYAIFGALFGYFVFDVPSVALGYYTYVESHYIFMVYGVPISMAFAEGFCVAITIYAYEKLSLILKVLKK